MIGRRTARWKQLSGLGILVSMSDLTQILIQIEQGDPSAASQLLPLVYDELRRLAAARLAKEKPGQTLQATALVHEAYLRLVKDGAEISWDSRGHFFAAAAEAMRRILIEAAHRKKAEKRGGQAKRVALPEISVLAEVSVDELLSLDDAIEALQQEDGTAAKLAEMRIFAGYSIDQAGEILGMSRTSAYRMWTYVRAWLKDYLRPE